MGEDPIPSEIEDAMRGDVLKGLLLGLETYSARWPKYREGVAATYRAVLKDLSDNGESPSASGETAKEGDVAAQAQESVETSTAGDVDRQPGVLAAKESSFTTFLNQYWEDDAAGSIRSLVYYLKMFPGADREICGEYFALDGEDDDDGPGAHSNPERLGRYRLGHVLGQGSHGVVYLAHDLRLRRTVALKLLKGVGLESKELMRRFRREAEITSRLEHPGICVVYESGIHAGTPFIAMRFVDGQPLSERIRPLKRIAAAAVSPGADAESEAVRKTPEPPRTVSEIEQVLLLFEKVAGALHAAHQAGVVHRDIKPSNIMVTAAGEPILLDFGLAREDREQGQTMTGDLMGTPSYMSPEHLASHRIPLDRRADVYSLGVSLFEALTGHCPFEGPTRAGLYQAIMTKEAPDPRRLNPGLSKDLCTVIATAMEKDRDRRYQTAADLAGDLLRVRKHYPIVARPTSRWLRSRRWVQRNPALSLSCGLTAVSILVALVASWIFLADARASARRAKEALRAQLEAEDPLLLQSLIVMAEELWPRRVELGTRMDEWLERAAYLIERFPKHRASLEGLRARAIPITPDDSPMEATLRRHRLPELMAEMDKQESLVAAIGQDLRKIVAARRRERLLDDLATHEQRLGRLRKDPRLQERLLFRFSDSEDERRHRALVRLTDRQEEFVRLVQNMRERRAFALTLANRAVDEDRLLWESCIMSVRNDARFRGLKLKPVEGLVPLGRDQDSLLWEFWHVDSGGSPPWKGQFLSGRATPGPDSGIVLVLLPGGPFTMGAQGTAAVDPNYDAWSRENEAPLAEIDLDPFFMAKFEVTQHQWAGVMEDAPSEFRPPLVIEGHRITPQHPVERVSWSACAELARRFDLELPTEAQWEYAARGGSHDPWWPGADERRLDGVVNLLDETGRKHRNIGAPIPWNDGHAVHAPVGSFPPNRFGLHEVLGNVAEWCRDVYVPYGERPRLKDGLRWFRGARDHVYRGGGFGSIPVQLRVALRKSGGSAVFRDDLGCRLARRVEP